MKIRFAKIKAFCKRKWGIEVKIHLSTEMPNNRIVYGEQIAERAIEIIVNANVCKDEEHVIVAVARMLAHVVSGANNYAQRLADVLGEFANEFGYDFEDLLSINEEMEGIEYGWGV